MERNLNYQRLYWDTLVQLRFGVYYLSTYRMLLEKWDTRIQTFLAITSSSSIAGWAIWDEYGMIWGGLIAASQVVHAVKHLLPFQKRAKALGGLCNEQEKLALDAESQWFSVFEGKRTDEEIFALRIDLKRREQEAVNEHFKSQSLPTRPKCETEASRRTEAYFALYARAYATEES